MIDKDNHPKRKETGMVMTVAEVADVLRVTPTHVRHLISGGRIPAEHHPTSFRLQIKKSDLTKYIKQKPSGRGTKRKVDS